MRNPPQIHDDGSAEVAVRSTGSAPWYQLRVHAAVLGVLLLALVPLFDSYAPGFPDEGLYSAQVHQLSEGSWSGTRPALDVDPDGEFVASIGAIIDGDEAIPYARRPAYPLLLAPAYSVGGTAGLLLVSALSTWLAALGGALIARRLDHRFGIPALWLLGIGSPLLFDAYLVVGHSLVTALFAMMTLVVAKIVDDRAIGWLAGLAPLVVAVVLIRSEGTLAVAATAAVLALSAVRLRPHIQVERVRAVTAGVISGIGAAAFLLDGALARGVSGGLQSNTGSVVSRTDPVGVMWLSVLRPWSVDNRSALVSIVLVVIGTALAAVLLKAAPRRPLLPVALLVLGASAALWRHFEPIDMVSGMLPAFPVVVFLMLLSSKDLHRPIVVRLLVVSALCGAGILVTVYEVGGAAEWGGRFFHILLPLLAPLIILGLDNARRSLSVAEGAVAAAAIAVIAVGVSVFGLRANYWHRTVAESLVVQSMEFADESGSGDSPLVVYVPFSPSGASRLYWQPYVDGADVIALPNMTFLPTLLETSTTTDRSDVTVITNLPPDLFLPQLGESGRLGEWVPETSERLPGTRFYVVQLTRADD